MSNSYKTREPQYQACVDICETNGLTTLGLMTNQCWKDDPRRLGIVLARYKFVAKMLSGAGRVLEVGCGDAFGTRVVLQEVESITAIDFDPIFVNDANERMDSKWPIDIRLHDILDSPVENLFDAAYSLDVLEHISLIDENRFVENISKSLRKDGVFIVGSPSIQSQAFASPQSKMGHINCKDHIALKALLSKHFKNIFLFSMNDEVVHTGFYYMAHYLIALCCGPKNVSSQA